MKTNYLIITQLSLLALTASSAAFDFDQLSSPASQNEVLSGKEYLNQSGQKVTGSMTFGADIAGPAGQASFLIPQGYYDGTKNATVSDPNLSGGNIANGVTIFGITGTAAIEAHLACTSNGQTGCVGNASFVAGAPMGNVTGANGALAVTLPQGFYDGGETASIADSNLTAANIKNGTTIFGVTGSMVQAYAGCSDNSLNADQCSTATSRYVTATAGAAITGANGSLTATIPQGFYSGAQSCGVSDTNLLAGNIKSGVNLFGIDGSFVPAYASCTDDALNAGQCSTAAGRYVTATAGAAITGANGSLTSAIPQGFYDGTTSATMSDSDLLASNIISGVTIFGVEGSIPICSAGNQTGCVSSATFKTQATPATPAGAADALSGKTYYTGGGLQTGTMNNRGTWNIETTTFPGAGYYNGITSTLAASDICSAKSLFGSTGTATCQSGTTATPASGSSILASLEAWDGTGAKITGTIADRGTLNAALAFPGAGYYSGTTENLPTANQLCSGTNALGVTGSANCSAGALSNTFHNKGSSVLTATAEATTYAGLALPADHRDIPKVGNDTDAYYGAYVTKATRPTVDCGTTQATIALRIADCLAQNPTTATWDGTANGIGGETIWKLVARNGANNEVWQDQGTGLLWSTSLGTIGWCHATGSSNATEVAAAYREVDPSGYCSGVTYQNQTNPESVCFEAPGFATTYVDAPAKGGLKAASTPAVRWRLPTLNDYFVADTHGIRFVLPASTWVWTSTIYSGARGNAYAFNSQTGQVSYFLRSNSQKIQCVGRGL
ncbi:MAG TPA: hypothetical protein VJB59_04225 [Bdellovibrionota bacterium]|nr:hypothetical protein [Bdellovibrionota bacterium]